MAGKFAFQLVQTPSRSVHILSPSGIIESKELSPQLFGVFRLDAGLRTGRKEPLDTSVSKGLYHRVYCIG